MCLICNQSFNLHQDGSVSTAVQPFSRAFASFTSACFGLFLK